jgi:hypothetical protein
MSERDEDTSLGRLLVDMGAINEGQLNKAIETQENSTLEQLLGAILVHMEYCSKEDVDAALSAQKSLRSGKKARHAMAVADLAIHRKKVNGARDRAIASGERFVRSASGLDFQAITPEMLAKGSGER